MYKKTVTTYGYMLSSYFKCIKTKIKLVMVFCYVLCQWKNAEKQKKSCGLCFFSVLLS